MIKKGDRLHLNACACHLNLRKVIGINAFYIIGRCDGDADAMLKHELPKCSSIYEDNFRVDSRCVFNGIG